jgi:malonyl-CoA O-methyltransferase
MSILNSDKKVIEQKFNFSCHSYDAVATIQKTCAKQLITMLFEHLPHFTPPSILDLGTGTGYVPDNLLPSLPFSDYTLNDMSPKMLDRVKEKFYHLPQFQFHLGDMETAHFNDFELIISNFALQWTNSLNTTIQKFYSKSKTFAFTCLIDGTFTEWKNILRQHNINIHLYNYPAQKDLEEFLRSLTPSFITCAVKDFVTPFENPQAFMKYLKNLGASYFNQKIPFHKLKKFVQTYEQQLNITYKVFFCILKRK